MKTETLTQPVAITYPTLVTRVQSMFVDGIFILFLMFGLSAIIDRTGDAPGWVRGVLFIGLWFVYEPLSITLGCSLGQYLFRLRVRKYDNERKKINIFQSFIRFALKFLLGWISFLTIHTNPQRRAIHDLASNSVMTQIVKPELPEE
jgi:uncharacterized RDD family membrane protein YckC